MARQHPGALTERVAIQAEVRTPDGGGGYTMVWATVATVWAAVEPAGGREVIEAEQIRERTPYRVLIRNRRDITVGHRLVWRNQPMDITAVPDPGPRALYREITAETGGAT